MPHAPRMADFFILPSRRNFRFQSILCEWIFPHRSKCWLSLYRHTLNRILSDSIHIFMYYLQIVTWKLGETCLAKSSFETLQSFKFLLSLPTVDTRKKCEEHSLVKELIISMQILSQFNGSLTQYSIKSLSWAKNSVAASALKVPKNCFSLAGDGG